MKKDAKKIPLKNSSNSAEALKRKKEKNREKEDKLLDQELKDTFPASDSTAKY